MERSLDALRGAPAHGPRGTYRPLHEAVPRLGALHRKLATHTAKLAQRAPCLRQGLLLNEIATRLERGAETLDRVVEDAPYATLIVWMQYSFLMPLENATEQLLRFEPDGNWEQLISELLSWFRAADVACQKLSEGAPEGAAELLESVAAVERRHAMELSDSWVQGDMM